MSPIKNLNDVMVGVVLVAIALFALWLAWPLKTGTVAAMGPGYFPRLLCFIQIVLGLGIIAQGFTSEGEPFEAWFFRPLLWVLASIVFFGLTVSRFGLVVAVVGLVLISCLGHRGARPLEAILVAVGMALFAVLTFPVALSLPIPVWPTALVP